MTTQLTAPMTPADSPSPSRCRMTATLCGKAAIEAAKPHGDRAARTASPRFSGVTSMLMYAPGQVMMREAGLDHGHRRVAGRPCDIEPTSSGRKFCCGMVSLSVVEAAKLASLKWRPYPEGVASRSPGSRSDPGIKSSTRTTPKGLHRRVLCSRSTSSGYVGLVISPGSPRDPGLRDATPFGVRATNRTWPAYFLSSGSLAASAWR